MAERAGARLLFLMWTRFESVSTLLSLQLWLEEVIEGAEKKKPVSVLSWVDCCTAMILTMISLQFPVLNAIFKKALFSLFSVCFSYLPRLN